MRPNANSSTSRPTEMSWRSANRLGPWKTINVDAKSPGGPDNHCNDNVFGWPVGSEKYIVPAAPDPNKINWVL
jgi:hypothetical protein